MATKQQEEEPSTASKFLVGLFWSAVIIAGVWWYIGETDTPPKADAAQVAQVSPTMTLIDTPSSVETVEEPVIRPPQPTVTVTQTATATVTVAVTPTPLPMAPAPPKSSPSPAANKEEAISKARRAWCAEHDKRVAAYNSFGAMSTNRQASSAWAQDTKKVLGILYTNYTTAGGKPEPAMAKYTGPLGHIIGGQWLKCSP